MGNQASSADARSLRAQLVGVDRVQQHAIAYQWAKTNGKFIDLLGDYAKQRGLLLFRSGNECENWIDPVLNLVYKMNTLMHVGEDIAKLFDRIEWFNYLFPATEMRFVGFQAMSSNNVYPIFIQSFVPDARFATGEEIDSYMSVRGFCKTTRDGEYENEAFIVSDLKPKNVLVSPDDDILVIDAEISKK